MWSNCKDRYNNLKIVAFGEAEISDKLIKKAEVDGCYNACLAGNLFRLPLNKSQLASMESNCKVRCTTKRKGEQTCVNDYVNTINAYETANQAYTIDQNTYKTCMDDNGPKNVYN
jgi:hypothetical protein